METSTTKSTEDTQKRNAKTRRGRPGNGASDIGELATILDALEDTYSRENTEERTDAAVSSRGPSSRYSENHARSAEVQKKHLAEAREKSGSESGGKIEASASSPASDSGMSWLDDGFEFENEFFPVDSEMKKVVERANKELETFKRAALEKIDSAARYHLASARTNPFIAEATYPSAERGTVRDASTKGKIVFVMRSDVEPEKLSSTPTIVYDALFGRLDFMSPEEAGERRRRISGKNGATTKRASGTRGKFTGVPTPGAVKAELDKFVAGQERAKRALAVAACAHAARRLSPPDKKGSLPRTNVLLAGPTGCGKTYMVKKLAGLFDVPFVCVDATQYTNAGFKGENIVSIFRSLLDAAGGDVERASQGIVYVDEADKLSTLASSDSVLSDSKSALQTEFLKAVEGSFVGIPKNQAGTEFIRLDTDGILFIFGGCFSEVEKTVRRRLGISDARRMGFLQDDPKRKDGNFIFDFGRDATPDDVVASGFSRELVGRFSVFASVSKLEEPDLVEILETSAESPLVQYRNLFEARGIRMSVEPGVSRLLAKYAAKTGTGARALGKVCALAFEEALYALGEHPVANITVDDVSRVFGETDVSRTRECEDDRGCSCEAPPKINVA